MEGPLHARKVHGRSLTCTESSWKVPYMHGKLMEGPADALKVDGILTEGYVCIHATFREFPSTFCACTGSFVSFRCFERILRQIMVLKRHFCPLPVCRHQLSMCPWELLSTLRMFVGPSINFPSSRKTFRQLLSTFRASAELPLNFVSFSCVRGYFKKFRTAIGSSVNFSHLSCSHGTFRQLSVHPRDIPSTSVNFSCIQGTVR